MNFNSPQYLLFLPAVLLGYAVVFRRRLGRDLFLLLASYAFYMAWNWQYAGLIAFSTVVDYLIGLRMGREQRNGIRRLLLVVSLVMNLGLLGLFKYYNFFSDVTGDLLRAGGWSPTFRHHELLLPVGISFYTFQTLSYTIDLYRRHIPVERNFVKFALFVSFFPQLVAGPIVRASEFLPQLQSTPNVSGERFARGLRRIFRGLFKKVIIADLLAGLGVDAAFANPGAFSSFDLLLALYGYAFQIYNDFSGYSDIAIGTALLLGFDIPENFDRPYLAQNVREFWSRWHISLSTWLRDYLYIPLGGSRGTPLRTNFNLMLTMLLGGLWHGAAMNFICWGAYHGLLLILARGTPRRQQEGGLVRFARRLLCFHLVLGGWLLFRVTSMQNFTDYVRGLADLSTWGAPTRFHLAYLLVLGLGVATHFLPARWDDLLGERLERSPAPLQGACYAAAILLLCGVSMQAPAFIYFQF